MNDDGGGEEASQGAARFQPSAKAGVLCRPAGTGTYPPTWYVPRNEIVAERDERDRVLPGKAQRRVYGAGASQIATPIW